MHRAAQNVGPDDVGNVARGGGNSFCFLFVTFYYDISWSGYFYNFYYKFRNDFDFFNKTPIKNIPTFKF